MVDDLGPAMEDLYLNGEDEKGQGPVAQQELEPKRSGCLLILIAGLTAATTDLSTSRS